MNAKQMIEVVNVLARKELDAAQAARDLYTNLTEQEFGQAESKTCRKVIPIWQIWIAGAIAKLNDCKVAKQNNRIVFFGLLEDAKMAVEMLDKFTKLIRKDSQAAKEEKDEETGEFAAINAARRSIASSLHMELSKLAKARKIKSSDEVISFIETKNNLVMEQFGKTNYKTPMIFN